MRFGQFINEKHSRVKNNNIYDVEIDYLKKII